MSMSPKEIVTLRPQGRLDAANAPVFEAEIKQRIGAGHVNMIIDLSGVRYISSNGLRTLLGAVRTAKRHGGSVKLCCLRPRLIEIFEMAGFDQVFEIFTTRDKAEKAFS
jgi:anti-sigma B factor antagonist